jgi:geranylgeranyl diphosphate synthase type II
MVSVDSLNDYLAWQRARIEAHLQAALRPQVGLPASLLEAMRYCLLAPAKRLRPLLVVMAAEACGASEVNPWPAACAVEMIHTYSLVHDDLPAMDDDDLRRGLPTCHKKFGEAMAILTGDALQALAFETLAEGYRPKTAAPMVTLLARAAGATGMVGGQVDDLALERSEPNGPARSLEGLEALHLRKTGALIRACLQLGVHAGYAQEESPAPEDVLERFDGYGRSLGLAFQIVDDLLDVEGNADQTGKAVRKDAARNKLTYPGLLGVDESRQRAQQLGEQARSFLQPMGPEVGRLIALVSFVLERDR